MTGESSPLLALGAPEVGHRRKKIIVPPRVNGPGPARQGKRLAPQFQELVDSFDNQRAQLTDGEAAEVDPELVLVFDLAGSVADFRNAVKLVEGLEFLTEFLDESTDPDDDFHMVKGKGERTSDSVQNSLYLVMSNAEAVGQLVRLFQQWQDDPSMKFNRGLSKFRTAFEQLRAIRRWGPEDRVRDTGLIDNWRERLEVAGQSFSPVVIEIELWYRGDERQRSTAEAHLREIIRVAGGSVIDRAQIEAISYHALLVELPVQQVRTVLQNGAGSIQLLTTDEIMFVSPFSPMSIALPTLQQTTTRSFSSSARIEGLPRIALLDGLPFVKHEALDGRLVVDDPDDLQRYYSVASRKHGTAMASLIVHGDLSAPGEPLERPLYVRPIMRPSKFSPDGPEQVVDDKLFTDFLHSAIIRIIRGTGNDDAAAPSVRIVNLSIGSESRAFVRRISPVGRLLDWLAVEYNLLFIVSAGNHGASLPVPTGTATNLPATQIHARQSAHATSRQRGILPPGDSLNALTVGAVHDDASGEVELPDTVWEIGVQGMPALYGAVGPGVGRSIKPDLLHFGGRQLHSKPVLVPDSETVKLELANPFAAGPGTQVATPDHSGATDKTAFSCGTSNATALVSREASRLFDILESGADADDCEFPDPLYHPVLVKALLVHASSWGPAGTQLREILNLDPQHARKQLSNLLGYGALDVSRLGSAATNRAVLIAGSSIAQDGLHTYNIPLPPSLRARRDWHQITITLAYMCPTAGQLTKYRGTKVFFETPFKSISAGSRVEADHNAVQRGSCQHEIICGDQAMIYGDNDSLPIHVECMKDAQKLAKGKTVRYGLVVSIEAKVETSVTIRNEVRAQLRTRVRTQTRSKN